MARIISIDYGTKRVGLAVTDPLQMIATALDTVHSKDVMAFLKDYIEKEEVEAFVLGMPVNLDLTETDATPHVKSFHKKLLESFPKYPIHLVDERFTSKMAMDTMIRGGMKKKDRRVKGNVDKISAVILLQEFLERKS